MSKKFRDISRATPQQREASRRYAHEESERMGLTALRRARRLSQQELAERLGVDQGAISRIEHQNDMLVRSLRRFVEAAGGELVISVRFSDDRIIEIEGIGDLEATERPEIARAGA